MSSSNNWFGFKNSIFFSFQQLKIDSKHKEQMRQESKKKTLISQKYSMC